MQKISCKRCENAFYTAAREPQLPCPYCGYVMKASEADRRLGMRTVAQKVCDILKGEVRVPVKTVDISDTGMGIKMMGYLPFDQNETVNIFIKELEVEKRAQVVWTKKFYGISRAGLRFVIPDMPEQAY
ncbi:MAG: PilZ domain-containing protein [Deltaproteobacteria bacterium]|nr:PilZ domain-containing protein [Deltaproteobacteria bacterium]